MTQKEFDNEFKSHCGYLKRLFPRLKDAPIADLVQDAYLRLEQRKKDGEVIVNERAWVRRKSKFLALTYMKGMVEPSWLGARGEAQVPKTLRDWLAREGKRQQRREDELAPGRLVVDIERRGRQEKMLSNVLEEFCRLCEQEGWAKKKEAYERALRGQKSREIVEAMKVPKAKVDKYLWEARQWILDRIRKADVHKSVFETLHQLWRKA